MIPLVYWVALIAGTSIPAILGTLFMLYRMNLLAPLLGRITGRADPEPGYIQNLGLPTSDRFVNLDYSPARVSWITGWIDGPDEGNGIWSGSVVLDDGTEQEVNKTQVWEEPDPHVEFEQKVRTWFYSKSGRGGHDQRKIASLMSRIARLELERQAAEQALNDASKSKSEQHAQEIEQAHADRVEGTERGNPRFRAKDEGPAEEKEVVTGDFDD